MTGGALLRPAAEAPPLLRLPSILGGGASELGSGVSAPVAGTGVEFDSSDFSPGEGTGGAMEGVCSWLLVVGVDEEGLREAAFGETMRASASGATVRVTMRVFRDALKVDFAGVAMVLAGDVIFCPGGYGCRVQRGGSEQRCQRLRWVGAWAGERRWEGEEEEQEGICRRVCIKSAPGRVVYGGGLICVVRCRGETAGR